MCARGQIFPSETCERVFPVIFTTFPLTTFARIAQRAGQFKQDETTHFSSGAFRVFLGRGCAEELSNGPMIWFAPNAAPVNADNLRKVLLFTFNLFCFFSFDSIILLLFILGLPYITWILICSRVMKNFSTDYIKYCLSIFKKKLFFLFFHSYDLRLNKFFEAISL